MNLMAPMTQSTKPVHTIKSDTANGNTRLTLNLAAIAAAKNSLNQGAMTPHYGPWSQNSIALLTSTQF